MKIGTGTCIIGLITSDEIVIGADSLRSYKGGKSDLVCKIGQVGRTFFASSGLNIEEDEGFDVAELCRSAISQGGSIAHRLDKLEEMITNPLKTIYKKCLREEPDYYHSTLKGNPVSVAFFGVEDGRLVLSARIFDHDETGGEVRIDVRHKNLDGIHGDTPEYICMGGGDVVNLAHFEAMGNHRRLPDPKDDKVGYINYMIQWAMDHEGGESKSIGGPINILQLKTGGAGWLQNGLGCPKMDPFENKLT